MKAWVLFWSGLALSVPGLVWLFWLIQQKSDGQSVLDTCSGVASVAMAVVGNILINTATLLMPKGR